MSMILETQNTPAQFVVQRNFVRGWSRLVARYRLLGQAGLFHQLGARKFSPFNATSKPKKQASERKTD